MVSMSGWILSMKVLLISAGVVSLAVGLRFFVPVAVEEIPLMWSAVVSWLKPPYLYLIINGIIISIAASSRFLQSQPAAEAAAAAARSENLISVKTPPPASFEPFSAQLDVSAVVEEPMAATEVVVSEIEQAVVELRLVTAGGSEVDVETAEDIEIYADDEELRPVTVNGSEDDMETPEEIDIEADDKYVLVDPTVEYSSTPPAPASKEMIYGEIQPEFLFPVREKPLVTSRFAHRKPNRTTPEGSRPLRVAKAKKHETLESTWKMITEGRHVPLMRHHKKSDAFEHGHAADRGDLAAAPPTARIGKEPSPGQEELNRRVEAFIKKINEEMRMQRQESLKEFMETINREL